jgi:hypothetical protein
MKRQFVVNHLVPKSDIFALLDNWITNTCSIKTWWPQKIVCTYIFVKTNIQVDTKKRELLKNPTKIEEIQEKIFLQKIEPLKLAF